MTGRDVVGVSASCRTVLVIREIPPSASVVAGDNSTRRVPELPGKGEKGMAPIRTAQCIICTC